MTVCFSALGHESRHLAFYMGGQTPDPELVQQALYQLSLLPISLWFILNYFFVQGEIKIYFHFSTCRHRFSWHHFVGETVFSSACFWHLSSKWGGCTCWLVSGYLFYCSSSLCASLCYYVCVLYNLKSATPMSLFLLLGIALDVWSPSCLHFFLVIRILMRIVFNLFLVIKPFNFILQYSDKSWALEVLYILVPSSVP